MKRNFINLVTATSTLGLLLTLPDLANAEDYYAKTRGYRVEPAPDPPAYVRNLSKTQFEQFRDIDWLNVGLEHRTRYEYRENDYRFWTKTTPVGPERRYRPDPDNLFLLRTRAYLGIQDILDPLRFAVEFQNSSSENGLYERTDADVNEHELIQGYGELYFKNALGFNRPFSIRAGRMHLELLDRRLIANNEFRNTTNNFLGYRVRFGKQQNDWDLDTFALQPLERLKYQWDRNDEDTWIYGGVLSIRRWSEFITIQPYFIGRKVDGDPTNSVVANRKVDQDIYAPGLRVYGVFPESNFDFDADINKQFGRVGKLVGTQQTMGNHDALAYAIELGYTFDHDWKPRASVFYGYGTGDKNGLDNNNQRFDPFYGFNQPWSRNDYFSWDNLHAPKARLEFVPYKEVRVDTGFNAYWLENESAPWTRAALQDRAGKSGNFLGYEWDLRLRHKLNPYVDWSMSYAYFSPGDFTRAQNGVRQPGQLPGVGGPYTSEATNFFYFEVSLNAFGDGKPTYK